MTANSFAYGYLRTFFGGGEIQGGLAFREQLEKLKLDHSLESLRRIDGLLAWVRLTQKPKEEEFLARQDGQNLLYLLAFYVGETLGRLTDATVNWYSYRELCAMDPSWQVFGESFVSSLVCLFNQSGPRSASGNLLPLNAIVQRLFGPDTEKSVKFSAEWALGEIQGHVPALDVDVAAAWAALSPAARKELWPQKPTWMNTHYARFTFDHYEELFQQGRVVWGRMVQGNNSLFAPGPDDAAAEVLFDPSGEYSHMGLIEPARALFALKGTLPRDVALRPIAHHLTEEYLWASGQEIPPSISEKPLQMSTLLVHRQHLPDRRLVMPYFPLLLHPRQRGIVAVLPSCWWPAELVARWRFDPAQLARASAH